MITLALDFAIIAIIAFCGWRGYKNGLIRGVFGIVSLVVSLFIASIAANAYSGEFTEILDPFVGGIVDSTLSDIISPASESDSETLTESETESGSEPLSAPALDLTKFDNESDSFINAYSALRRIGLPESPAARIAGLVVGNDEDEKPAMAFSDIIADKLSSALAFVAVFGIAFVLLAIIFAVIGNLIGFVFSLPGLRILDAAAGVVFGLAKGFIIVCALTMVVRYIGLLAPDMIDGTSVLKYLVNNNPIADRIGI